MKILKQCFFVLLLLHNLSQADAMAILSYEGVNAGSLTLVTDRSTYISGESVLFSVFLEDIVDALKTDLNTIVFVELITPEGIKVFNGKFLSVNASISSCFPIPADLLSGFYFLRAYTAEMRALGPGAYSYKQLRIINPATSEVLKQDEKANPAAVKIDFTKYSSGIPPVKMEISRMNTVHADSIAIHIFNTDDIYYSLSVVSDSIGENDSLILTKEINKSAKVDSAAYVNGLTLTGRLTAETTGSGIAGKKVNLSIVGNGRDFMAVRTDKYGRFTFVLPKYTGERDVFLCAEKNRSEELKIVIDNDFCSVPVKFTTPEFAISEAENKVLTRMAINEQLHAIYYPEVDSTTVKENDTSSFYGTPTNIIYIDKYILLPTLEEYFNELPSQVKVRKNKGESYFAVMGLRGISFNDPLVLIDWVAVDEPGKVLAISPQSVSRIEIVNEEYVKGDITYGGIISIISKKGDFAGIDLPSTGVFINYSFITQTACINSAGPDFSLKPDTRNTFLWVTGKMRNSNNPQSYSFKAPVIQGRFRVVLQGVNSSGEQFQIQDFFTVSE